MGTIVDIFLVVVGVGFRHCDVVHKRRQHNVNDKDDTRKVGE
jgi:hypothetical protein